jgi:SNF2 family DNA or RNA helicase
MILSDKFINDDFSDNDIIKLRVARRKISSKKITKMYDDMEDFFHNAKQSITSNIDVHILNSVYNNNCTKTDIETPSAYQGVATLIPLLIQSERFYYSLDGTHKKIIPIRPHSTILQASKLWKKNDNDAFIGYFDVPELNNRMDIKLIGYITGFESYVIFMNQEDNTCSLAQLSLNMPSWEMHKVMSIPDGLFEEQIEQVYEKIKTLPAVKKTKSIRSPIKKNIELLNGIQPKMYIELHLGDNDYPFAKVAMLYDTFLLSMINNSANVQKITDIFEGSNNTSYSIERDMLAEKNILEQAMNLGINIKDIVNGMQANSYSKEYPIDKQQELSHCNLSLIHIQKILDMQNMQDNGYENSNFVIAQANNWDIELTDKYELNASVEASSNKNRTGDDKDEGNNWFDFSLGLSVNGQVYDGIVFLRQVLKAPNLLNSTDAITYVPLSAVNNDPENKQANTRRQFVGIETKQLQGLIAPLFEILNSGNNSIMPHNSAMLAEIADFVSVNGAHDLQRIGQKLREFKKIESVTVPPSLQAQLRDYQQDGLNWLNFLYEHQLSGILADDMGLGKTLQTIAHIVLQRDKLNQYNIDNNLNNKNGETAKLEPILIVVPTSVTGNWQKELDKFAPHLKVLVFYAKDRKTHLAELSNLLDYDVIITTYSLVSKDIEELSSIKWHMVILDEAQYIKNAVTQNAQAVCQLKSRHRLCLTGTPIENHLGELWSQFNFLLPRFLGTHKNFSKNFTRKEVKNVEEYEYALAALQKKIHPFILRRTKQQVATELPAKTEIIQNINMDTEQRNLYELIRAAMDSKVQEAIAEKGFSRSRIAILDALLKLRQICCHPRLLRLNNDKDADIDVNIDKPKSKAKKVKDKTNTHQAASAKFDFTIDFIKELIDEGRSILLFSQFVEMLDIFEEQLKIEGIEYSYISGKIDSTKRQEQVDNFQSGKTKLFLLSLKSGGVGLNLTAADTVINYDPWWNPATEKQAIDRAYRIGQDKPVFVYRLITQGTIEEKINILQQKKQALMDNLIDGKLSSADLTANDLEFLFKPSN